MTENNFLISPRSLLRSISPPVRSRKRDVQRKLATKPADQASRREFLTPWARTPLNPALSAIRVMRLHRGAGDKPVKAELQVVFLDDEPYYEVLSYVWGDQKVTKEIDVDGLPFQATVNLFNFLLSLRLVGEDRVIWADAICIDQSSEQEKSHQIELMTRIYRQANEAHVWFGPFDSMKYSQELESDHRYTAMNSMSPEKWELYQKDSSIGLTYLLKQDGFRPVSQDQANVFAAQCQSDIFLHTLKMLDEMAKGDHLYTYPIVTSAGGDRYAFHKNWLAVMDCVRWLVTRPWWSRVWTLQEATLPRADPVVHAPPYTFRLSRLADGVNSMWRHNNSICCKWFGAPVVTSNRDNGEFGATFMQCRAVHAQRSLLAEAAQDGMGVPLDMVTSATQERKATEIRDHWYGIFGFLPDRWQAQSKMFPTPETTAELFSQYSNLLYLESGDLTLLGKARRCKESAVDKLPTWAIDLSNPRTKSEEDGSRWELYSASGNTSYDRTTEWLELRSPSLQVKAIYVSNVQACVERVLPQSNTTADLHRLVIEWLTLYRESANPFDTDAFWRACFMDRNVQMHWLSRRRGPLSAVRLKDIKDWWKAWNRTGDHQDLTVDRKSGGIRRGRFHHKELQMNARNTRFIVTSQGLPGMGPHDAQTGDEIYALEGCSALAVLRPLIEEGKQRLTLVGLCFVDRWMYGRATQGGATQRGAMWKTIEIY